MKRDLLSAYAATAAKVLSWAFATALLFRAAGAPALALLALVRLTIGILNAFGLSAAMIRFLSGSIAAEDLTPLASPDSPQPIAPLSVVYSTGLVIALAAGVGGFVLVAVYGLLFNHLHHVPAQLAGCMSGVVCTMGAGVLLRLMSDVPGAMLQSQGRIALDNLLLMGAELLWAALCLVAHFLNFRDPTVLLPWIALMFAVSGVVLACARTIAAGRVCGLYRPEWNQVRTTTARALLAFALLVWVASLADFLYAPTDFILINHFLTSNDMAAYMPAVQIDSALLLLVSALAAVMLPKAALAHGAGDVPRLRRYYINGTAAAVVILASAALITWRICPVIFQFWLHNRMEATQAIMPLLLIHTVIGGSSTPGRAILLAGGRVRPYTVSVLIAGAVNVLSSYFLAVTLHMALRGIVLGTIVAVVGRCGIWMPWYVWRTLAIRPAGFEVLPPTVQ